MKRVFALAHGILSTDATWVDAFTQFVADRDPTAVCVHAHYYALPLPLLTNFILDPLVARRHVHKIVEVLQPEDQLFCIGHSNGGVIVLRDIELLNLQHRVVSGAIFIDAAIDDDLHSNGIMMRVLNRNLGWASAYCSHSDQVLHGDEDIDRRSRYLRDLKLLRDWLQGRMMWPWGSLGAEGWTMNSTPYDQGETGKIFNRWHAGGHSACFNAQQINKTFDDIWRDVNSLHQDLKSYRSAR